MADNRQPVVIQLHTVCRDWEVSFKEIEAETEEYRLRLVIQDLRRHNGIMTSR